MSDQEQTDLAKLALCAVLLWLIVQACNPQSDMRHLWALVPSAPEQQQKGTP